MTPTEGSTTRRLARHILTYHDASLSADALTVAKQCVQDWFAVTIAACDEPAVRILQDECTSAGRSTLVGSGRKAGPVDAALVNGTASHALDYDDCHLLVGHPTAPVLAAALAVGEDLDVSGPSLLRAVIGGVETSAAIGSLVLPVHYDRGFHATATLGTFGAAAAAGLLLGLDEQHMIMALGLAGAQAAGLKSMFGTMAKPLHAGKAAANGVLAARLARSGFTAAEDVLDVDQGFIDTQGRARPSAHMRVTTPGDVIIDTLFKYHAACYLTHPTIDTVAGLRREYGIEPEDIAAIDVHVDPAILKVCNILEPKSGLQVKFSLRYAASLAVFGADTSAIETYSDKIAACSDLVTFSERVRVHPDGKGVTTSEVVITLKSGEKVGGRKDLGAPIRDLPAQQTLLDQKYRSLTEPVIGKDRSARLHDAIENLATAEIIQNLAT